MALVRFNPFNARIPSLWRDFDELLRDFTPPQVWQDETVKAFAPPADIAETEHGIEVYLDMPGFKGDDIDVKLEDNVLVINAERKYDKADEAKGWVRQERSWGKYSRSFNLPATLDGTKLTAAYKNGVLIVTLPKKPEAQPRSVKVKVEA